MSAFKYAVNDRAGEVGAILRDTLIGEHLVGRELNQALTDRAYQLRIFFSMLQCKALTPNHFAFLVPLTRVCVPSNKTTNRSPSHWNGGSDPLTCSNCSIA